MPTNPSQDDLDLGATIRGFAAGQVVFGRYRLDRILGRGGMGVVWLAQDQEMGEQIALKFLPEVVRMDASGLDELKTETRKSRKLTHRNIVRVHDFVSDSSSAGIAMEWVDGSTLSALRLTRPSLVFDVAELGPWVKQVCEALEYAHTAAKIIHRDLKPANIMLTGAGEVKIADFGISSSITESASRVSAKRSTAGTLAYMSPQQALGERPSVEDDIYSLGATIYELLAGKPPFFRGELYAQVRDVIPPPMAERREECEISGEPIPEAWEKTVAACLEKDPKKRPQSAMEVAYRLGLVSEFTPRAVPADPKANIVRVPKTEPAIVAKPTAKAINPLYIAAAAAALVLIGVIAFFATRPKPAPVAVVSTPSPTPALVSTPVSTATPAVAVSTPTATANPQIAAASPTLSPVNVDKQLVGSWQSGTSRATRKHWDLQGDGRYLISVGGTVVDTGTMSAANGQIEQFSKSNPQPFDVTYSFDQADVTTQGNGPFDGTEWHRATASSSSDDSTASSTTHHSSNPGDNSDDNNGNSSAKQQMINSMKQRYGGFGGGGYGGY